MARIDLIGFIGEIPKLNDRVLPETAASLCFNTRLTDGGLEPIRQTNLVHTFDPAPSSDDATIYRHNGTWLSWDGLVHVAPGPVATDRLYVTGDGVPKMIVGGTTYNLKVEAPTAQLTGTVSGSGTGNTVTRLYEYTFVTDYGEESKPSPLTDDITWQPGQTVTLSGFQAGDAGRAVSKQRIYRTQTGPNGTQSYFIAERNTTTSDFVDNIPVDSIQEPIQSTNYDPPPDDLKGLIALPNGIMAGFVGKDLYFSEPYKPHAWPFKYVQTVDYNIVALGAFSNSVVIGTEGSPYTSFGTTPSSMIMDKMELNLPCVNARGMVDLGYAVAYPSNDGLVIVDSSGASLATQNLFSRDDWYEINPDTFASGQHQGRYFASYDYLDFEGNRQTGTYIIDLSGEQPFIIRTDVETRTFYYEIETGFLFYLNNGSVYQWDAEGLPRTVQEWISKDFILTRPTNFGVIRVDAESGLTDQQLQELQDEIDQISASNTALVASDDSLEGTVNGFVVNGESINGDALEEPPSSTEEIVITVYADGVVKATTSKINQQVKLPAGYKSRKWKIGVNGNVHVTGITMASSGVELRGNR